MLSVNECLNEWVQILTFIFYFNFGSDLAATIPSIPDKTYLSSLIFLIIPPIFVVAMTSQFALFIEWIHCISKSWCAPPRDERVRTPVKYAHERKAMVAEWRAMRWRASKTEERLAIVVIKASFDPRSSLRAPGTWRAIGVLYGAFGDKKRVAVCPFGWNDIFDTIKMRSR